MNNSKAPTKLCQGSVLGKGILFLMYLSLAFSKPTLANINGNLLFRHYTHEMYKAHPSNWCMVTGRNGYLYFGNRSVVLEYDGIEWRKIPVKQNSPIYDLTIDSNGKIYLGTTEDFGYLDKDSLGHTIYRSLLPKLPIEHRDFKSVWKVHSVGETIYFQSNEAIFEWKNGRFKVFFPSSKFHFSFLIRDTLYVKDIGRGLVRLQQDSLILVDDQFKGSDRNSHIYGMQPYGSDEILIATRGKGLYLYNQDNPINEPLNSTPAKPFKTADEEWIRNAGIYKCQKLSDGRYALASLNGGLMVMTKDGHPSYIMNDQNGLPTSHIRNITEDSLGALWLSTNQGIIRVAYEIPITKWDQNHDIHGTIFQIIKFKDVLYVATSKGVYYQHEESFHMVAGLTSHCWDFELFQPDFAKSNESLLLVAADDGIYQISGTEGLKVSPAKSTLLYQQDSINWLWVSTRTGIKFLRYERDKFVPVGEMYGLNHRVVDIIRDGQGRTWFGTDYHGVLKVDSVTKVGLLTGQNTEMKRYGFEDGIDGLEEVRIETYGDKVNILSGHKIYEYVEKSDNFKPVILNDDASSEGLGFIFMNIDENNNYWVQRNSNTYDIWLEKWSKNESGIYELQKTPFKILPRTLIRQVFSDANQQKWVVASDCLYKFNGKLDYQVETNHSAILNEIQFDGNDSFNPQNPDPAIDLRKRPTLAVPYTNNDVTFSFSSNSHRDESLNEYRYKLEGYDKGWTAWDKRGKARYTNLNEGTYEILVETKNFDNIIGERATYKFQIERPWYRTYVAYAVYIILTIMLFRIAIWAYLHRLQEQKKQLEKRVLDRTRKIEKQKDRINEQVVEIKDQNDQLSLLNKEKNFLLGTLAHDLKNPINSMYSITQLIKMENTDLKEIQKEYIGQMEHLSYTLGERVSEVIDMASIESDNFTVTVRRGDLSSLVIGTVNEFQAMAARKKIDLIFKNGEVTYFAFFEARYMKKVLENLIVNAIKYSPVNSKVELVLREVEYKLRVEVKDQGPGVSTEDQAKLFRRFTVLSAQPTGGEMSTGLGLSIVKRYVEAMKGQVWYEDNLPNGATFVVEL